eukprot:724008-Pleurochrysis_carterae.AAC.4
MHISRAGVMCSVQSSAACATLLGLKGKVILNFVRTCPHRRLIAAENSSDVLLGPAKTRSSSEASSLDGRGLVL